MPYKKQSIYSELQEFAVFLRSYLFKHGYKWFGSFEFAKGLFVDILYQQRGKYTRPVLHTGMIALLFLGVTIGPLVVDQQPDVLAQEFNQAEEGQVLGVTTEDMSSYGTSTLSGEGVLAYRGGEVIEYQVKEGETISQIAERYGLTEDTVLWANGLQSKDKIKVGQKIEVLPVDGIMHKVKKGDTVYSVAKKYESNPQAIVDYPFNTFINVDTFSLAIGQEIMVPDGILPKVKPVSPRSAIARNLTPNAGKVSANGRFVWPATGRISQGYRFYHKAIDIANKGGGPILAADAGTVTVSGWPSNEGYGNRVIIDHGNGFRTLYAHLSKLNVVAGQTVKQGDVLGTMGSTGRSTGTHLHFEIRQGSVLHNPLNYLN